MLDDERLAPVFAIAAERRVPILIHGGRGLPPIADHLAHARRLVSRGAADHRARRHRRLSGLAGALRRQGGRLLRYLGVEPDRPAGASSGSCRPSRSCTPPTTRTAQQPQSLLIALRTARASGARRASRSSNLLAGNANRIADGEPPLAPSQPQGSDVARAADGARPHPPVPLDGDADAVRAPAGQLRRARARAQRDERAQRPRRGARPDSRGARSSRATSGGRCPRYQDDDRSPRRGTHDASRLIYSPTSWRSRRVSELALTVNGHEYELDAPIGMSLAQALREVVGLTGTKIACNEGHCGACTVQIDGVPTLSCITLAHTVSRRGDDDRRAARTSAGRCVRTRRRRAVRFLHARPGRLGGGARRCEPEPDPLTRSAIAWRATSAAAAPIRESRRRSCIGATDPYREGSRGPVRRRLARRRGGSAGHSGPTGRSRWSAATRCGRTEQSACGARRASPRTFNSPACCTRRCCGRRTRMRA